MDFKNLNIKTRKEALELIYKLEQCRSLEDIDKFLPNEMSAFCHDLLKEGKVSTIEELKMDIKSYIKEYKDIDIHISFEPSKKFESVLEDLFEPLLKNCLLNIVIDPSVIAGAIVTIDGKLYDESLKKKISGLNNVTSNA